MPTALISVYNKDGIVPFAQELSGFGWKIVSSGGTAKVLKEAGLSVTDVAEITGFPAVLGHRVVTLAPQVHSGLLATEELRAELEALGWPWFDLCCVDFYPLNEAIKAAGATEASVLEKTDIGGPTMVRSAAKGRRIVVVDPHDRQLVIDWIRAGMPNRAENTRWLATKAEAIVGEYCLQSACFHSGGLIKAEVVTAARAWKKPIFC